MHRGLHSGCCSNELPVCASQSKDIWFLCVHDPFPPPNQALENNIFQHLPTHPANPREKQCKCLYGNQSSARNLASTNHGHKASRECQPPHHRAVPTPLETDDGHDQRQGTRWNKDVLLLEIRRGGVLSCYNMLWNRAQNTKAAPTAPAFFSIRLCPTRPTNCDSVRQSRSRPHSAQGLNSELQRASEKPQVPWR